MNTLVLRNSSPEEIAEKVLDFDEVTETGEELIPMLFGYEVVPENKSIIRRELAELIRFVRKEQR